MNTIGVQQTDRSLLDGDTDNAQEDIELRIYLESFCTSCQISSLNRKARSKNPLKPKSPFKRVFMDTIPSTAPKILTSDPHFSNCLLIVDAYSKTPKPYCMEKITTEEVTDKLDIFQYIFGKNRRIQMVGFGKNSNRCRYTVYLDRFQRRMPNSQSSFDISRYEHQEINGQFEVT